MTAQQLATPVYTARALLVVFAACVYWQQDAIQTRIDSTWNELRNAAFFKTVYFETIYTVTLYTALLLIPATIDRCSFFAKYKIRSSTSFEHPSTLQVVVESLIYIAPLAILDTFMVKWYDGVPAPIIAVKRRSLIQHTRALPVDSPTLYRIVRDLILSLVIYDALFFVLHFILHKVPFLYRHIHARHHDHAAGLQSRVTNQLTVVERIVLVLSANGSLKVLGAHPLTRVVYVPIFLWLLIDNHSGYDFPLSVDKLVPFGLVGGSKHHYEHHTHGKGYYEPYFTYLDRAYVFLTRHKGEKWK